MNPGSRTLLGAFSVAASQVVRLGTQLVALLILTRLLTPEDFGIFAMINPLIALATIICDAGVCNAIIRRPSIGPRELSTIFYCNVGLSVLAAVLIVLSASSIALFFREVRLVPLINATAVTVVVATLSTQHSAIAAREHRFTLLAAIDTASLVLGLAAALLWAVAERNYWALWLFPSVTTLASTVLYWTFVTWRPGRAVPLRQVADIVPVALGIAGNSLLDFSTRTFDKVLIGRLLGAEPLGLYDRVYKIVLLPLLFVNIPLERLLVPLLSRSLSQPDEYRLIYQRGMLVCLVLISPGLAVMAVNSRVAVGLIFGPEWLAAAPVFKWLCLACLAQLATQTLSGVWISQGRTGEMFACGVASTIAIAVAFAGAAPYGLVAMAASYGICEGLRMPLVFWWAARRGPIGVRHYVAALVPSVLSVALTFLLCGRIGATGHPISLAVLAGEIAGAECLAVLCLIVTRPGRELLTYVCRMAMTLRPHYPGPALTSDARNQAD